MNTALVIVDMQKYYLKGGCNFYDYYTALQSESMSYLEERCYGTVIPNLQRLAAFFRSIQKPVIFLRLCGEAPDRSDLHRFFRIAHNRAIDDGYTNLYPTSDHSDADIIDELAPQKSDIILNKKTFSPFGSTNLEAVLGENNISTLVFSGLATSQCVETSARDASDRGYSTIHIDDAQADYTEESHYASLYSSQPVCGGWVYTTDYFIAHYDTVIHSVQHAEEIQSSHK